MNSTEQNDRDLKNGFHKNLIQYDISSLFFSYVLHNNICPSTFLLEKNLENLSEDDINEILTPDSKFYFLKKNNERGLFTKVIEKHLKRYKELRLINRSKAADFKTIMWKEIPTLWNSLCNIYNKECPDFEQIRFFIQYNTRREISECLDQFEKVCTMTNISSFLLQ